MKKIITAIEWTVFVLLLIATAVIASPLLPSKDWASFYVVVSGSMEPAIPTGSLIMTKQVDTQKLQVGDIIAFTSPLDPKQTITHRIASVKQQSGGVTYTTKGDNNQSEDSWTLLPDQIKGKYNLGIPYIGYPIEWAKTPLGFTLIIGLPALVLVILQIRNIRQGINEEVEKRTRKAIEKRAEVAVNVLPPVRTSGPYDATVIIAIAMATALLISTATPALALFSAQIGITDINLMVGSTPNPTPTPSISPTPTPTVSPTPAKPCRVVISYVAWRKVGHHYRIRYVKLHRIDKDCDWSHGWRFKYYDGHDHKNIDLPRFNWEDDDAVIGNRGEDWDDHHNPDCVINWDDDMDADNQNDYFDLSDSQDQIVDRLPNPHSANWSKSNFQDHRDDKQKDRGWWDKSNNYNPWWK